MSNLSVQLLLRKIDQLESKCRLYENAFRDSLEINKAIIRETKALADEYIEMQRKLLGYSENDVQQ